MAILAALWHQKLRIRSRRPFTFSMLLYISPAHHKSTCSSSRFLQLSSPLPRLILLHLSLGTWFCTWLFYQSFTNLTVMFILEDTIINSRCMLRRCVSWDIISHNLNSWNEPWSCKYSKTFGWTFWKQYDSSSLSKSIYEYFK